MEGDLSLCPGGQLRAERVANRARHRAPVVLIIPLEVVQGVGGLPGHIEDRDSPTPIPRKFGLLLV